MKHILQLTLGILIVATSAIAGSETAAKSPRVIPGKIDADFKPEVDVEYTMEGEALYHHDYRRNPGPAEIPTSAAWSLANEFVYRTALAKEYVVPAAGARPRNDGWYQIFFIGKDGKYRWAVEVQLAKRIVRLTSQDGQQSGEANSRPAGARGSP